MHLQTATWAAELREQGFVRIQIGDRLVRLGEEELPAIAEQTPVWALVDRLEAGRLARERLTDSNETAFARGNSQMALLTGAGAARF